MDKRGQKGQEKLKLGETLKHLTSALISFLRELKKENLPKLLLFILLIITLGGGAVFLSENRQEGSMFGNIVDALWWGMVTITTVGYGDKYPVTLPGRIFAAVVMLMGIVIISLLSGTIASIYVDRKIQEGKGLQELILRNHMVLCGWNNTAEGILEHLVAITGSGKAVLVLINDILPESFQDLKIKYPSLDLKFVKGDFVNEKVLKRGSAHQAHSALIIPDTSGGHSLENADERTILAVLALKSINPDILTCAEVVNPENKQHLIRANVDDILVNGEFSGYILAHATKEKGIPRIVREMLSKDNDQGLKQVSIPGALVGKTFWDLTESFLKTGKGVVVGILSEEKKITLDDILSEDSSSIDAFIKRKFQEAEIDLAEEQKSSESIYLAPPADYIIKDTDKAFVLGRGI